jgi:hypothetical protein
VSDHARELERVRALLIDFIKAAVPFDTHADCGEKSGCPWAALRPVLREARVALKATERSP